MASRKIHVKSSFTHFLTAGFLKGRYLVPMLDRKITLFLSHAWEDKQPFVEELYQALKDEYDQAPECVVGQLRKWGQT